MRSARPSTVWANILTGRLRRAGRTRSMNATLAKTSMYLQILGYVPSTVIPAIMSFMMIYVYTRLLTPADYGTFSLIFSAMLIIQTSFFFAIPVALTRFYPEALVRE